MGEEIVLAEDLDSIPSTHIYLQLFVTPVRDGPMPSSSLQRYQVRSRPVRLCPNGKVDTFEEQHLYWLVLCQPGTS